VDRVCLCTTKDKFEPYDYQRHKDVILSALPMEENRFGHLRPFMELQFPGRGGDWIGEHHTGCLINPAKYPKPDIGPGADLANIPSLGRLCPRHVAKG
jgi:hypothetical protein